MEFKFFPPIGQTVVKRILPEFVDNRIYSPQAGAASFEQLATDLGLGFAKGAIIKNTLQFFSSAQATTNQNKQFPALNGTVMPSLGRGALGFPVYSNLIIKGDTYQDNNGTNIGTFNDIRIDAIIMEMEQQKNLVKTDIQGRSGTVIEFISAKSATVHCYGRFSADIPGVFPTADVQEFINAMNSNKALRVQSWYLAMLGIYNIVVENFKIKQEEGSQEYQKFEFDAIADRPVILKLANT